MSSTSVLRPAFRRVVVLYSLKPSDIHQLQGGSGAAFAALTAHGSVITWGSACAPAGQLPGSPGGLCLGALPSLFILLDPASIACTLCPLVACSVIF